MKKDVGGDNADKTTRETPGTVRRVPQKMQIIVSGIAAVLAAAAGAFIFYCERLQLLPLTAKGRAGRLAAAAVCCGAFFFLLYFLLWKAFSRIKSREWLPIILITLLLSICGMVWYPMPDTGLYPMHELSVRNIPDENGDVRPITLTWLHRDGSDVQLSTIRCIGSCAAAEDGLTLPDENAELVWQGITGKTATVEFISAEDQGIAEISWDGTSEVRALHNIDFSRLSFDRTFPPSAGLAEFIACFLLMFLLCFALTTAALKALPGWNIKIFGPAVFVLFIIFRIYQFSTVTSPLTFVDTESYLGMSEMPVTDILKGTEYCHENMWYCIARPAFIPLVYKLCGQDLRRITIVQLMVSLISWGFFAQRAAALCRTDIRRKLLLILVFGLGCVPNVTRWDQIIMSESLSISAALLLMGSCFWLLQPGREKRWQPLPALCTALSAWLYAQSRDSAVWTVILILGLLLILNRLRSRRKVLFLLCAALAFVCRLSMSNTGQRWQYPFENVLFCRIARTEGGIEYFIEAGMPTPPRIEELYGVEHMMSSELFNSEEMAPLREWILSNGLKTYVRYMLRTPSKTLKMAWSAGFEKEAFEQTGYIYTPTGFQRLLPETFIKFFSCNLPNILMILLGTAGIWKAFCSPEGERFVFPLLFLLSAYVLCTGVILADEYEFARHSMVILIMMKAAAWPLIVMLSETDK